MPSTFGKSTTFTGLSGLVTKGLVRITSPLGAVRRKIDQEKYSSVTGFCCAIASDDHSKSTHAARATKPRMQFLCIVLPLPVSAAKAHTPLTLFGERVSASSTCQRPKPSDGPPGSPG